MLCQLCVPHTDSKETHLAGLPVTSHTAGVGASGAFWGCSHAGVSMFFTSRKVCRASKQPTPSGTCLSKNSDRPLSMIPQLLQPAQDVLQRGQTRPCTTLHELRCLSRRRRVSKQMDSEPEEMSARKTQSALLHSVVPEAWARHEMRRQALKAPC